jgi:hypothetical protein
LALTQRPENQNHRNRTTKTQTYINPPRTTLQAVTGEEVVVVAAVEDGTEVIVKTQGQTAKPQISGGRGHTPLVTNTPEAAPKIMATPTRGPRATVVVMGLATPELSKRE